MDDKLTEKIIGCCYDIHRALGPGFTEKIYHRALIISLNKAGLQCDTEKQFDVLFEGEKVGKSIVDLVVDASVIVELKAITGKMPPVFRSQVLSYLRASGIKVGLLINFGNSSCEIKRLVI